MVKDPEVAQDVWWGKVNQPISPEHFDTLLADVRKHLDGSSDLFVQDLWAGADRAHRLSVRFVSPNAWHMQFVRNMFLVAFGLALHAHAAQQLTGLECPQPRRRMGAARRIRHD